MNTKRYQRNVKNITITAMLSLSTGAIAQAPPGPMPAAKPNAPRPAIPASAFLPIPSHAPAQRFGVATHLKRFGNGWTPDLLPMVRALGVSSFRDEDSWSSVEREKGVYQTSPVFEEAINKANTLQMEPLMTLVYRNKLHGDSLDAPAFARYANWMIGHYKGRVKYFEVWNEPDNFDFRKLYGGEWNGKGKNGEHAPWLKKFAEFATYVTREIKKEHPEVILIGYSATPPGTHRLFEYPELWKNLDVLAIHPYPYNVPPEVSTYGGEKIKERDGVEVADNDHSFPSLIRRFREGLAKAGRPDMPIWITEIGYTTAQLKTKNLWLGMTENGQAIYNTRLGILAAGEGIERTFFYDFYNDGNNPHNVEENYGLVRHDYTPKPSYFAIQRLCSLMPGDTKVTKVPVKIERLWPRPHKDASNTDGERIEFLDKPQNYAFTRPDGSKIVFVWQAGRIYGDAQEELANLTLTVPQGEIVEIGRVVSGQKLAPKISREGGSLVITEIPYGADPVYIVLK